MEKEKDFYVVNLSDPELCYSSFVIVDATLAMLLPEKGGVRVYLPDIGLVRLEKRFRYRGKWYWDYRIIKKDKNNACPYYTGSVMLYDLIGLTTVPKPKKYKKQLL